MPTERELKTMLAELQERHPLKDETPIKLLFGGWGFASADLKDRSIVIPRSWLKSDSSSYFTIIHEYAHFLSEDNATGTRKHIRHIHNFLAHDRLFKETENALMAEYGITFRRWMIYAWSYETHWGNSTDWKDYFDTVSIPEILSTTAHWNLVALVLALAYRGHHAIESGVYWPFITIPICIMFFCQYGSQFHQMYVRQRYRKHSIRRKA